jgi:hypothetical protein
LADARGKAAMKMHLMGDQSDEDPPRENLLPRALVAPFAQRHHAVEVRARDIKATCVCI